MVCRYLSAMPMYWPVFASRIVPVSGSTMPPVAGSINWPDASVISPVLALTLDEALAELLDDASVLAEALLDAELSAEADEEADAEALGVLVPAVLCVNGMACWNLAQTSFAELDQTTRLGSEGAALMGMVCA